MLRMVRTLFAMSLLIGFAACGGNGGGGDPGRSAPPTAAPTPTPTPTPTPIPGQRLYATARTNCSPGPCTFTIDVFDLALYVNSTPSVQIAVPAGYSIGNLAVDAAGDLVACSFAGNSGNLLFYPAPLTSSSVPAAIVATGYGSLAFDSTGRLFVPTQGNAVKVFAMPLTSSSLPQQTITSGLTNAMGVALDASGNLFVSDAGATNRVQVFAPPYSGAPAYTIGGSFGALRGLAFDGSGNLYVSDLGRSTASAGAVHVLLPPFGPSSTTAFDVTSGINVPQQLAVDVRNNLYVASVASTGTLVMYAAPIAATNTPAFTLGAHFNSSIGVAVGP